ncbi:RluA family pseudouridine synthase [Paroceanicella profunda]|uniref:Pseudouridine synthase n=1 Tax=Paroceanicella profunda TaxID=2579971 RepID=A0A5B8G1W1_9RHOB|nr:RluA family pseudouridine synthase [Paroceanicella profunda]QDL93062.1 RluA family pseudouridine synthase [Paroceanicella profunda]
MQDPLHITLPDGCDSRLDKALAAALSATEGAGASLSRSRLRALIEGGAVSRAGGATVTEPKTKVKPGEAWVIRAPVPVAAEPDPEDIPLDIVFEDADLVVVNKPAGMVVHPAPGAERGTLVNALLHHCGASLSGIGGVVRPGIVHRIDKDTSGLLVVAKSDAAHQGLAALFATHDIERSYQAVSWGAPDRGDPRLLGLPGVAAEEAWLRIEGDIDRHRSDRKRMAVVPGGRHAVTRVRVTERFGAARAVAALVECRLETGRTHQIRVHLSHVGHPLVGDQVYGRPRAVSARDLAPAATAALRGFPRQALHAASLGFRHPVSGAEMAFRAPLPPDIDHLVAILRRNGAPEA